MKTKRKPFTAAENKAFEEAGFTETRSYLRKEGEYFCWRDQDNILRSPLFTSIEQACYFEDLNPRITVEEWPEFAPLYKCVKKEIFRQLRDQE